MACLNSNAPIDISMTNVYNNCDLKCDFSFNYSNSLSVVKNRGDHISFTYDSNNNSPVTYNSKKYEVVDFRIYTPSLHSFNSSKTDAEIIISHNSSMTGDFLLVCIPIKKTNVLTKASTLLKEIIDVTSKSAPSEGNSFSLQLSNFNLNTFVPKAPFFTYNGSLLYQPCNLTNVNYIVFNSLNNYIDITASTLDILKKIIKNNVYDIKSSEILLFYNPKGSNSGSSSTTNDEIYIDCKPTGETEEKTTITYQTYETQPITFNSIYDNQYFQILLSSIIFIIVIYIFYWFVMLLQGKKIKLPNSMNNT